MNTLPSPTISTFASLICMECKRGLYLLFVFKKATPTPIFCKPEMELDFIMLFILEYN